MCSSDLFFVGEVTDTVIVLGQLARLLLLVALCILNRKFPLSNLFIKKRTQRSIFIVGVFFQAAKILLHFNESDNSSIIQYIAMTILIMGSAMLTLWIIDWYLANKEREKLWQDNRNMSAQLHRSKEIMPALKHALDGIESHSDHDIQEVLQEIHQLCQEQMVENELKSMQNKQFPSTGIVVLEDRKSVV